MDSAGGDVDPGHPSLISSEEFLAGNFAALFKSKKYQEALRELDSLLSKYPGDPLILRYRALTLEELGRTEEAMAVYGEILSKYPGHVPTRLFRGLVYARAGKKEKAADELRWVSRESGSEEYRHWAEGQLNRLRRFEGKKLKRVKKKPYLLAKTRFAYDSNPLLIPDDEALASRERKDGFRYAYDVDLGYPVVLNKDLRVDILYIGRQTFHDKGVDDVNFTSESYALDAKKRTFFGERSVLLGARYDFRVNFLRSELFSVVNRMMLSADTSFWRRTRTHFYGRISLDNYGPDGSRPFITSRDGTRGDAGIVQYFYTADLKSHLFIKQEVSFSGTRGDNSDRAGFLSRMGIHVPVGFLGPTSLDTSVGFDFGTYPEFVSLSGLDRNDRRDARIDTYASLTYLFRPDLAARLFYRFIDSENQNDFFDRERHIAGMEWVVSV